MAKGIASRIARWLIKKQVKSMVGKLVKEKRLSFFSSGMVSYTDKQGEIFHLSLDEMANRILNSMGLQAIWFGKISESDIKDILVREYQKQKGGKQMNIWGMPQILILVIGVFIILMSLWSLIHSFCKGGKGEVRQKGH